MYKIRKVRLLAFGNPAIQRGSRLLLPIVLLFLITATADFAYAQGGALANGANVGGFIGNAGDAHAWTFHANSGDVIVLGKGGGEDNRLVVALFAPDSALVDVLYASILSARAPTAGTYTALVNSGLQYFGSGYYATGDYRLTLAKIPGAFIPGDEGGPMINGFAHHGRMPRGDLDMWTINAQPGATVKLQVQVNPDGGTDPTFVTAVVYAPDGTYMESFSHVFPGIVNFSFVAQSAGTYTVLMANSLPPWEDVQQVTTDYVLTATGIETECDFSSGADLPVSDPEHTERCFGAIGPQCNGVILAPTVKDETSCLVQASVSVGSIQHDRCCLETNNTGYSCLGLNTGNRRFCKNEWQEAWDNTTCTARVFPLPVYRQWAETFGPYFAGNAGDDTTLKLRAPPGTRVKPKLQGYCASGRCAVNSRGKTIFSLDPCGIYCTCE